MQMFYSKLRLKRQRAMGLVFTTACFATALLCLSQGQAKPEVGSKSETFSHYDVITIKPAPVTERGLAIGGTADTFTAKNVNLTLLLENAYNLTQHEIVGVPSSIDSKRFDIVAKLTDASPQALDNLSGQERQNMLKALLRDRFALKAHEGSRSEQVYLLTQVKGGAKIRVSDMSDKEVGGLFPGGITVSNGHLKAHSVTIATLVGSLTGAAQCDVIDDTKLPGLYDLDLTWDSGQGGGADPSGPNANALGVPSLFTALQEQLGLKLVPVKRLMPVLIVDHVEAPSPN